MTTVKEQDLSSSLDIDVPPSPFPVQYLVKVPRSVAELWARAGADSVVGHFASVNTVRFIISI